MFRISRFIDQLSDFDSYGRVDTYYDVFLLFCTKTSTLLSVQISKLFRVLLRTDDYLTCWWTANISPVPESAASAITTNDRPLFIISVLLKVF